MKLYRVTLSALGIGILVIALIHIILGASGEVLLGSQISISSQLDPALDSQNRFYGAAFGLYGVLFLLCAREMTKYQTILFCTLGAFFVAGLARLISVFVLGWPPPTIIGLLVIELLLPPGMLIWFRQLARQDTLN